MSYAYKTEKGVEIMANSPPPNQDSTNSLALRISLSLLWNETDSWVFPKWFV